MQLKDSDGSFEVYLIDMRELDLKSDQEEPNQKILNCMGFLLFISYDFISIFQVLSFLVYLHYFYYYYYYFV